MMKDFEYLYKPSISKEFFPERVFRCFGIFCWQWRCDAHNLIQRYSWNQHDAIMFCVWISPKKSQLSTVLILLNRRLKIHWFNSVSLSWLINENTWVVGTTNSNYTLKKLIHQKDALLICCFVFVCLFFSQSNLVTFRLILNQIE